MNSRIPKYDIWKFHSGKRPVRLQHFDYDQDLGTLDLVLFVKGAEAFPKERLVAKITSRSLHFVVENNSPGIEINFIIHRLAHDIDPSRTYITIESQGRIVITLTKVKPRIWKSVIFASEIVRQLWNEAWAEFLRAAVIGGISAETIEKEVKYEWIIIEHIYTEDVNFFLNPPPPYGPIQSLQGVTNIDDMIEKLKMHVIVTQDWVFKPDLLGAAILYQLQRLHQEQDQLEGEAEEELILKGHQFVSKPAGNEREASNGENQDKKIPQKPSLKSAEEKKNQGNKFFKIGRHQEAINCYTEAINIDPTCPTYYTNRAVCLLKLEKYQECFDDGKKAANLDAKSVKAHYYMAKSAFSLGMIFEGLDYLVLAMECNPSQNVDLEAEVKRSTRMTDVVHKYLPAIEIGRTENRNNLIFELLKLCPVDLKDLKKNFYADLLKKKRIEGVKALAALDLIDDPADIQAAFYLGKSYFYLDMKDEAVASLQITATTDDSDYVKLIEKLLKDINDFYFFFKKGDRALEVNDLTEAQNNFLLSVEVDPWNKVSHAKVYCKIGNIKMKQKDYKIAIKYFQLCLENNEKCLEARDNLDVCSLIVKKMDEGAKSEIHDLISDVLPTHEHYKLYKDVEKVLNIGDRSDYGMRSSTESKLSEGLRHQRDGEFDLAVDCYTEALQVEQRDSILLSLYIKRSQCYLQLEKCDLAYLDAVNAGRIENDNVDACLQMGKCCLILADCLADAKSMLKIALVLNPGHKEVLFELKNVGRLNNLIVKSEKAIRDKNYQDAIVHLEGAIGIAKGSNALKLKLGECHIFLDNVEEAKCVASSITLRGNNHPEYDYLSGLCAYHLGNLKEAIAHARKAQLMTPNQVKYTKLLIKAESLLKIRDEGKKAFDKPNFETSLSLYKTGLKIDPLNKFMTSFFHYSIGLSQSKLKNIPGAIEAFSLAISSRENYLEAYLKRAECYLETGELDIAIREYRKICRLFPSEEHCKLLQSAKGFLKDN